MVFPDPVIHVAVEPKTKADQEKMGIALGRLAAEDPSFRVRTDEESGPDHHFRHGRAAPRIIVDRMKREFRLKPTSAPAGCLPRVHQEGGRTGRQVRQTVGRSRPVRPRLAQDRTRTKDRQGLRIRRRHQGRYRAARIYPAVDKGLQDAVTSGVLAGFPVVDVKFTLFDGSYHDVDSNETRSAWRPPWPSRKV